MSEQKKMWFFNSIAVLGPAVIYVYLVYAPLDLPILTILAFSLVHIVLGFNCGGFYKCGTLVARYTFFLYQKCCRILSRFFSFKTYFLSVLIKKNYKHKIIKTYIIVDN